MDQIPQRATCERFVSTVNDAKNDNHLRPFGRGKRSRSIALDYNISKMGFREVNGILGPW
jgi:hypothetical protein